MIVVPCEAGSPLRPKRAALREAVKQRLEREAELSESQLRHLMSVAEGAQRIARLALGASTENVHTDPYASMTDQELAAELGRVGIEPPVQ